jgi:hypothetical protein
MFISVPNERGIPGFVKYAGRRILRRNPYAGFFENRSEFQYAVSVILNRPIESFRQPPQESWGPHLGFDWTMVDEFINHELVASGNCRVVYSGGISFNFNRLYVIERLQ